MEQDFIAQLATAGGHQQPVDTRTFQCPNCAVDFRNRTRNPFHNLSILRQSVYALDGAENHEIIPPHGIIPFAYTQKDADKALSDWFRKLNIHRPRVSPLVGEYVPVWAFDVSGDIRLVGTGPPGRRNDQANRRRLCTICRLPCSSEQQT